MPMEKIPDVQPGDRVSASTFNTLKNEVYRLSNLTVEAPLELTNGGVGPTISFARGEAPVFWVKVPEGSGDSTGWVEQRPNSDGTLEDKPGGRTGSNRATAHPASDATLMLQVPDENGTTSYFYLQSLPAGQYDGMVAQTTSQLTLGMGYLRIVNAPPT